MKDEGNSIVVETSVMMINVKKVVGVRVT